MHFSPEQPIIGLLLTSCTTECIFIHPFLREKCKKNRARGSEGNNPGGKQARQDFHRISVLADSQLPPVDLLRQEQNCGTWLFRVKTTSSSLLSIGLWSSSNPSYYANRNGFFFPSPSLLLHDGTAWQGLGSHCRIRNKQCWELRDSNRCCPTNTGPNVWERKCQLLW